MKLMLCAKCDDARKFGTWPDWAECKCGRSRARYLEDGHHAQMIGEHAVAIGVSNSSLLSAIARLADPQDTWLDIRAWVFASDYRRISRYKNRAEFQAAWPLR